MNDEIDCTQQEYRQVRFYGADGRDRVMDVLHNETQPAYRKYLLQPCEYVSVEELGEYADDARMAVQEGRIVDGYDIMMRSDVPIDGAEEFGFTRVGQILVYRPDPGEHIDAGRGLAFIGWWPKS